MPCFSLSYFLKPGYYFVFKRIMGIFGFLSIKLERMRVLIPVLFLVTTILNAQNIRFKAENKWVLPLGRESEPTEVLKHPLRIELKNKQLKLYYPDINKFYFKELVTPIKRIVELEDGKRKFYLLEFDHEGLTFYFRITKDDDPGYGTLWGIEIPVIKNGQIIAFETFY